MNICNVPPGIPAFSPGCVQRWYRTVRFAVGSQALLYSVVPLSEEEADGIIAGMDDMKDLNNIRRAHDKWNFSEFGSGEEGLRAVWDEHIRTVLSEEERGKVEVDALVFFVVTTRDWKNKGVLAINTIVEAPKYFRVDSFMMNPEQGALLIANLQVANMDWEDYKDWEDCNMDLLPVKTKAAGDERVEKHEEEETDNEDEEDDDNVEDPTKRLEIHKRRRLQNRQYYGIWPDIPPLNSKFLAVYVVDGVDAETTIRYMDDEWSDDYVTIGELPYKLPEENNCRLLGHLDRTKNLVDQACELHPRSCLEGPLFPRHFVVVDQTVSTHDGVILVELDWSGNSEGKEPGKLLESVKKAPRTTQRAIVEEARFICEMTALGYRKFTYDHWAFALFSPRYVGPELFNKGRIMDVTGGDRIIHFPTAVVYDGPQSNGLMDWSGIIKQFRLACRRRRFNENFHKHYFIATYASGPAENVVLLVGLDWDAGSIRYNTITEDDEVPETEAQLMVRHCDVETAYDTLKAIADGEQPFEGNPLAA